MITKQQLDTYFNENYQNILNLTGSLVKTYKRKYNPSILLSHGYEYLLSKKKDIPQDEIQQWLITFIKNNIRWENSSINKKEKIEDNYIINEYYDQIDDDEELNIKVKQELIYNEQKAILDQYRYNYLTDKQMQIVFDVYFNKQQSSCRKMGRHFNIHYVSAHKLIKTLKEDINHYINNIYNNNNNIK
jgi:hypothetical protein